MATMTPLAASQGLDAVAAPDVKPLSALLALTSQGEPPPASSSSAPSTPSPQSQPAAPSPPPVSSTENPGAAPPQIDKKDNKEEGIPATVVDERQLESVLGKNVVSASGENMGRIVDIMVDHAGETRAAIIDFGGFLGVGTRKIAVDWRLVHFASSGQADNITVDLTGNQLRAAPIYKQGEPMVVLGRPGEAH